MNGHKNWKKLENSENFCLAPWYSIFQHYNGEISVCCQTPVTVKNKNFSDAMNDERIKSLRTSFLKREIPEECKNCPKQMREELTRSCYEASNEILPTTDDFHKPFILDLLWDYKCNFSCLGCDTGKSSTIRDKYQEAFNYIGGIKNHDLSFDKKNRFNYILENADTIKYIHLTSSGEPWIQDDIYELVELLIHHKLYDKIELACHTNGSIQSYKGKSMIDYLSLWGDKATVIMSNDGTNKRGEYVRYGYKDNVWLKTYNQIREKNIRTYVHYCMNIFNIFYLEDDIKWFLSNCDTDIHLRFWEYPLCYSVDFLKNFPELFDKAQSVFDNTKKYFHEYMYAENYLLKKTSLSDLDVIEEHDKFIKSITKFDELRGTSFVKTFPELKDLYE